MATNMKGKDGGGGCTKSNCQIRIRPPSYVEINKWDMIWLSVGAPVVQADRPDILRVVRHWKGRQLLPTPGL